MENQSPFAMPVFVTLTLSAARRVTIASGTKAPRTPPITAMGP